MLYVTGARFDVAVSSKTLRGFPSGYTLHLGYECNAAVGKLAFGPSYSWYKSGIIWRRTWYEPDTVYFRSTGYDYYPTGEIQGYRTGYRRQDMRAVDTLITLDEYFERGGELAGFRYRGAGGQQYYWRGKPISGEGMRRKLSKLYSGRD